MARRPRQLASWRLFANASAKGSGCWELALQGWAEDARRVDHPQYDTSAVYEAVMNALAHRDLRRITSPRTGRGYLESRGEGVRRILSASERHPGLRPEYRLFSQELLLTIWAKPSPHAAP